MLHLLSRGDGLATSITRQVRRSEAVAEPDAYAAGIQRYGTAVERAFAHVIRPAPPSK